MNIGLINYINGLQFSTNLKFILIQILDNNVYPENMNIFYIKITSFHQLFFKVFFKFGQKQCNSWK